MIAAVDTMYPFFSEQAFYVLNWEHCWFGEPTTTEGVEFMGYSKNIKMLRLLSFLVGRRKQDIVKNKSIARRVRK
jgi:hypothetical protein